VTVTSTLGNTQAYKALNMGLMLKFLSKRLDGPI